MPSENGGPDATTVNTNRTARCLVCVTVCVGHMIQRLLYFSSVR